MTKKEAERRVEQAYKRYLYALRELRRAHYAEETTLETELHREIAPLLSLLAANESMEAEAA